MSENLLSISMVVGLTIPFVGTVLLGIVLFFGKKPGEKMIGPLFQWLTFIDLFSFLLASFFFVLLNASMFRLDFGRWFELSYTSFDLVLIVDELSLIFAILTMTIGWVVSAFAHRYLHLEEGYLRFFLLFGFFVSAMLVVEFAGSIEILFVGWEFLGLSSALLVAFFYERRQPVDNAIVVFSVYRISDAALISVVILYHHAFLPHHPPPLFSSMEEILPILSTWQVRGLAFLIILSALGKCAQLPFTFWLPRAMEGPTPSSAVFYGALSVHAGAFLLLRSYPIIEQVPAARVVLGLFGFLSACYATSVGRVQADIKSSLAYASATQIGIILVEIAAGFFWLPVVHMIGHALLRLLQFLRTPSLLHDLHHLQNNIGGHVPKTGEHYERMLPATIQNKLYRLALEQGGLEALHHRYLLDPVQRWILKLDRCERYLCRLFSAEKKPK